MPLYDKNSEDAGQHLPALALDGVGGMATNQLVQAMSWIASFFAIPMNELGFLSMSGLGFGI